LLSNVEFEGPKLEKDAKYAREFHTLLNRDLKIPNETIDKCERNAVEAGYADWIQKSNELGWFTMNVLSVPCIWVRT
jgi:hypothetical protein